jgi:hypothetical protein
VNLLIRAVNVVASLLGHPIHWDTETVGCNPSLSSIPVTLQRSFADALAELSSWLFSAEHQEEFLVVFLDEQMDIYTWVRQLNTPETQCLMMSFGGLSMPERCV